MTRAAIVGIGETPFSRNSEVSSLTLNLRASLQALHQAGLDPKKLDGIVSPAVVGASVDDLFTSLGLHDLSFSANILMGGAGPAAAIGVGAMAIERGQCKYVLVSFGYNGHSETRLGFKPPVSKFGESPRYRRNYEAMNGIFLPAQYYSLWATRYMHEFRWPDTAPLSAVAVTQREYAQRNPRAMRHEPLDAAMHQESRMISYPFRLFDCSQETDGAVAVLLAAVDDDEIATDPPDRVVVAGYGQAKPPQADQSITRRNFLSSAMSSATRRALTMAGVALDDLDFAELYDPFTFHVIWHLEAIGVCGPGEAAGFVMDGGTKLDGKLPVNTHGGLLSEAHLWGINHVAEAVRQLRRTEGDRQVKDASVGLVTGSGDFGDASALVLTREEV